MNPRELLLKSQTISIQLPPHATDHDTKTALLFACGLRHLGKHVSLVSGPSSSRERTFVVSLKGVAPQISRVRYEKERTDLKLYFTLAKGTFSPESLSVQTQDQTDLTLIVGNKQAQNNASTLSLSQLPAQEAKKALFELLASQEDPSGKLLGRMLSSLRYLSAKDAYLFLLQEEDFQKSQSTPKHIPGLFPILRESFGEQSSYLCFYSHKKAVQGVGWSLHPLFAERVLHILPGQQKESWILFHPTNHSLSQIPHALS